MKRALILFFLAGACLPCRADRYEYRLGSVHDRVLGGDLPGSGTAAPATWERPELSPAETARLDQRRTENARALGGPASPALTMQIDMARMGSGALRRDVVGYEDGEPRYENVRSWPSYLIGAYSPQSGVRCSVNLRSRLLNPSELHFPSGTIRISSQSTTTAPSPNSPNNTQSTLVLGFYIDYAVGEIVCSKDFPSPARPFTLGEVRSAFHNTAPGQGILRLAIAGIR